MKVKITDMPLPQVGNKRQYISKHDFSDLKVGKCMEFTELESRLVAQNIRSSLDKYRRRKAKERRYTCKISWYLSPITQTKIWRLQIWRIEDNLPLQRNTKRRKPPGVE